MSTAFYLACPPGLPANLRALLGLSAPLFRQSPVFKLRRRDPSASGLGPWSSALAAMVAAPPRPFMAAFLQGVPARVLAPQRRPGQLGPKRVGLSISATLTRRSKAPFIGC